MDNGIPMPTAIPGRRRPRVRRRTPRWTAPWSASRHRCPGQGVRRDGTTPTGVTTRVTANGGGVRGDHGPIVPATGPTRQPKTTSAASRAGQITVRSRRLPPGAGRARRRRSPRRSGRPPGARGELDQLRTVGVAQRRLPPRAAGVEPAAGRRVGRRRQVAGEQDPLPAVLHHRVRAPAPRTATPGCTGAAARRTAPRTSASSTSAPRYITPTRSEMCRTTARSCAMTR